MVIQNIPQSSIAPFINKFFSVNLIKEALSENNNSLIYVFWVREHFLLCGKEYPCCWNVGYGPNSEFTESILVIIHLKY